MEFSTPNMVEEVIKLDLMVGMTENTQSIKKQYTEVGRGEHCLRCFIC